MTKFDPLAVDVYALDSNGKPNWAAYCAAGEPWSIAALKVTEGTYYNGGEWLKNNWINVRTEMNHRYGSRDLSVSPMYRLGYHYWKAESDPVLQANAYLTAIDKAGGWGNGDIAVVDVETANNGHPAASFVVDSVSKFVERVKSETGKMIWLYGGSFMYDLGIVDQMKCDYLWIARYTATLPQNVYERIGWPLDKVAMWQYRGDNNDALLKTKDGVIYPNSAPGIGTADLSVLTFPGGLEGLRSALI